MDSNRNSDGNIKGGGRAASFNDGAPEKDVSQCVQVAVHIRPLIGLERAQGCKDCITVVPGKPQELAMHGALSCAISLLAHGGSTKHSPSFRSDKDLPDLVTQKAEKTKLWPDPEICMGSKPSSDFFQI